jgi:Domain of unknown function (DUF4214)
MKRNGLVIRKSGACLLILALATYATVADAAVPGQFIAKMYTEALGRAPDPQGWSGAVQFFQENGCNQALLTQWGSGFFSAAEFTSLAYDNAATTLILYRSILNREPDAKSYQSWLTALQNGEALQSVISAFFASSEFSLLVPAICSGSSYSFDSMGLGAAMEIPSAASAGYAHLSETQLQSLLDGSAPGSTVYLQQESVVFLTQPLTIPAGVTLATYGLPGPRQHALMARLIRASAFAAPMVQINADNNPNASGSLKNLWVDGQRTQSADFVSGAIDVEIYGGQTATVDSNFLANSLGWSTVHSFGSLDGRPCSGNTITNNVITAYPSVHANQQWTDGISVGCENTVVQGNQIVDPTDVGIVVFTAYPATQRSTVGDNIVVSAGNSAFGALVFDPLQNRSAEPPDFTGSAISNNTLWSGPNTHFIIGVAVGTRPWYGDGSIGYGASAIGNTTAGIQTRFGAGIVVSGMNGATVRENVFAAQTISPSWTGCPEGNVLASFSAGLASGSIQPYTDVLVSGCMSDYAPAQQPAPSGSTIANSPAAQQSPATAAESLATEQSSSTGGASPASGGGGALARLDLTVLGLLAGWLSWKRRRSVGADAAINAIRG